MVSWSVKLHGGWPRSRWIGTQARVSAWLLGKSKLHGHRIPLPDPEPPPAGREKTNKSPIILVTFYAQARSKRQFAFFRGNQEPMQCDS